MPKDVNPIPLLRWGFLFEINLTLPINVKFIYPKLLTQSYFLFLPTKLIY